MFTTILKSFDTYVVIVKTSSSFTLPLTGFGLLVKPVSSSTACGLSNGNKVLFEIVMRKYNHYKIQYQKDQQTIKAFHKLYRKHLQANVIEKSEYEPLGNIFTKCLDEPNVETFL